MRGRGRPRHDMNAFSQLNGQTSLPRGGQVRLSVDSSGAAFSQLNGFDFSERATQKTHSSQARAFSQLNARAVGGRATHVTKHSTSGAARRGRRSEEHTSELQSP